MKRNEWEILSRIGGAGGYQGGFRIYLHLVHLRIAFPFRRADLNFIITQKEKIVESENFLREKCSSGKSPHRLAETLGILDLYVAARFSSKITK